MTEGEAILAMRAEDERLGCGAKVIGPAARMAGALRLAEFAASSGGLNAAVLDLTRQDETAVPLAGRQLAVNEVAGVRVLHRHAPLPRWPSASLP